MIYAIVPGFMLTEFQRISIASSVLQAQRSLYIAGAFITLIFFVSSLIPYLIYNINNHLDSKQLLPYILNNYTRIFLLILKFSKIFLKNEIQPKV